jgi:hypothetical protein
LKKNIKNFAKDKDKEKIEIKFDDSQSRAIERNQNYNSMVKVNNLILNFIKKNEN